MKSSRFYQNLSKTMSYILRHRPENFGIQLSKDGSVDIQTLLSSIQKHKGYSDVVIDDILHVVSTDEKGRYTVLNDRIWANQGHSIKVDVRMSKKSPISTLYHGTAERNLVPILKNGLSKMNRNHVHLSSDVATALNVGSRHGSPIVLRVDAPSMVKDGYEFYLSENGVWLTHNVPPDYLEVHDQRDDNSSSA